MMLTNRGPQLLFHKICVILIRGWICVILLRERICVSLFCKTIYFPGPAPSLSMRTLGRFLRGMICVIPVCFSSAGGSQSRYLEYRSTTMSASLSPVRPIEVSMCAMRSSALTSSPIFVGPRFGSLFVIVTTCLYSFAHMQALQKGFLGVCVTRCRLLHASAFRPHLSVRVAITHEPSVIANAASEIDGLVIFASG